MDHQLSRHHIIAKNNGGTWHRDNIVELRRDVHDAVHFIFDNDLPIEILRGVTEKYRTAIDEDVYKMINGVLRKVEGIVEAYNPNCFHEKALKEYLTRKKGKTG